MTLHRIGSSARRYWARAAALLSGPFLVLLVALIAHAHDFWLVPDPFQVAEGRTIEVLGQTSSRFPTSEAAVAVERVTEARAPAATSDSAAVVATVEQFHRALANGDSLGALALMTEDVVVLESGGFETRAEFRLHHLPADIEFARATRSERRVRGVTVRGDAAWVSTTSTAQGAFRGRTISSAGAELAVLVRAPSGWRISAIHWSSRARRG